MNAGQKTLSSILLLVALAIVGATLFVITSMSAQAQSPGTAAAAAAANPDVLRWAFVAAAAAAGLSTLAAGYAVAVVGSAAVGALAEKPELLGRVLILVGLAEGIAIYGLIVAILILNKT
jgi:V/A-type H+-transporting ATPase subunit K